MKEIDARLPECPDVEEKWEQIAKAYIPDGIKEFRHEKMEAFLRLPFSFAESEAPFAEGEG
jgi:hypothetical protein